MHRTSARPAPLNFLSSFHPPTSSISQQKDVGNWHRPSNVASGYCEPPIRDGLRTPPSDDMSTTYQPPHYNGYSSRQDPAYPAPLPTGATYSAAHAGTDAQPRPYLSQPAVSGLRNEVQSSQPLLSHTSPQPSSKSHIPTQESSSRRKSATSDMIVPNLQIPSSINNSGGSLAEFAAQVRVKNRPE